MNLVYNPIKNLSLDELGITDGHLNYVSEIHNAQHTNRVIYNALALCLSMGWRKLMPMVWAAAFLHDLGRDSDGIDDQHGAKGAARAGTFSELFKKAGLRDLEIEMAMQVATFHSLSHHDLMLGGEKIMAEVFAITLGVLVDADVMDRIRLGERPESFRYTNKERAPYLARYAHKLYDTSVSTDSMKDTWSKAVGIFCPHLGAASKTSKQEYIDGPSTLERRLSICRDKLNSKTQPADWSWKIIAEQLERQGAKICTYLSPDSWIEFTKSGKWLNFWNINQEKSWHKEFSDIPEDSRAYNEGRLFGEKCDPITHAVLLENPEQDYHFRHMYGQVRITWNYDVLDSVSWTPEDSQENAMAFPLWFLAGRDFIAGNARYLELQIHKQLTRENMMEVDFGTDNARDRVEQVDATPHGA